jgi:hypothetical protein
MPRFGRAQSDAPPSSPVPAPAELQVRFSPGVRDVLKMLDAKVEVSIVQTYIKNSQTAYNLSATEIIALKRRGVPDEVIANLIQHGAEVRVQMAQAAQANAPLTPPAGAAPYAGGYADTGAGEPYPYYGDYGYGYPSYASYPYASYPYYGYPYYGYNYGYPWGFYSSFYSPFYFGYYGHRFHGFYGHRDFDRFHGGHSFARGSIGNRGGAWSPVRGGVHGFGGGSFTGMRAASFGGHGGGFATRSGGFSGGHFGGFGGGHAGGFSGGHGGGFGGGHGGGHR